LIDDDDDDVDDDVDVDLLIDNDEGPLPFISIFSGI